MESYAEAVRPWHDFFLLGGEASATLVGLLFVAMSVASGFFNDERRYLGARVFFSPSLVLFACVLFAALIAVVPTPRWRVIGVLIGGEGCFGVVYAGFVWRNMVRAGFTARLDLEDTLCYVFLPAVCHLVVVAAGILFLRCSDAGCDVLAAAIGLLLAIGIRNAWDMTVWTITHSPPKLTSAADPALSIVPSAGLPEPPPAPPSSDPRPAG